MLPFRSVVFTLLLPLVLVGWVPLSVFERHPLWNEGSLAVHEWFAIAAAVAGLAAYLHCAWEFTRKGRGTVAPFDAPRKLVQRGLYRWVRNPMYLSLGLIVAAEAVYFESWRIGVYLVCLSCLGQLIVVLHEESDLSFRFGAMYEDYKRAVPRWLPRAPKRLSWEEEPRSTAR
jgi:protein-S-isoprenylcysteine O-methyltransferase Ste14